MFLSRNGILCHCRRSVSTQGFKQAAVENLALDDANVKESYYKKIGSKVAEDDYSKPDGWDNAKPFSELPGPKPIPILGNTWRFLPWIGEFHNIGLIDLHKRFRDTYGDIAYFSGIPSRKPIVFSYNPDDFEAVFRNEGPWPRRQGMQSYVHYQQKVRHDIFQGVGGVLTTQGEEWFKFRSTVNKILMQPRTSEMYVDSMDKVAEDLIGNIRYLYQNDPENMMPSDFQNELYKWTMESIGVITYNKRIGALERNLDKTSEAQMFINNVLDMFKMIYKLDVLPSLWSYISTPNWRKYLKILNFLTETNQKYIHECMESIDPDPNIPDHERSVLERLLRTDRRIAIAMTTDMLIAGIDTTGKTMAASLYYLAKNPEKQQRLREELKKHLPTKNSAVDKEMLKKSPYLKAVIKETTRLAPISVGTLRTTMKDLVLSGYQIPRGSEVVCIHILVSLDEEHYLEADKFIPERWLRTTTDEYSQKNVHPFVTLPFGFGPRSCIGKRLANLELEVGLSKIIRNFELSWPHPDVKFGTTLLYGIESPLRLKVAEAAD